MEDKFCSCRSNWSYGLARECRRGLVRGMGYTEQEFDRPIVAVVNSWNEYNPGHVHLRALSERVKQGIREAGGLPFEMMTTGICDGMVLRDPKYVELPSRNLIADEVELTVESNMFDAMVLLSTCDSIVPGHLMAAARLDIPAVVVTGGYMPMPYLDGSSANYIELTDHVGKALDGSYDRARAEREVAAMYGPCGACGVMTTANSMCLAAEALGMSLPGNATASAHSSELLQIAYRAGRQVMELLKCGITARKIITRDAVENAIRETMATAGSTNLLLHLPAIATEAGLDGQWWKLFDEASRKVPLLVASSPSGPWHFQDIDRAGGSRALFAELMPLLHGDVLTVTGKTLRENYADAVNFDPRVITTLNEPGGRQRRALRPLRVARAGGRNRQGGGGSGIDAPFLRSGTGVRHPRSGARCAPRREDSRRRGADPALSGAAGALRHHRVSLPEGAQGDGAGGPGRDHHRRSLFRRQQRAVDRLPLAGSGAGQSAGAGGGGRPGRHRSG